MEKGFNEQVECVQDKDLMIKGTIDIITEHVIFENTTEDHTCVLKDVNNNTDYFIQDTATGNIMNHIHFQSKPVFEGDLDGIFNEDLLLIVKKRLEVFQEGKFACESNVEAIKAIDEALAALRRRTNDRKERNVLGTYEV